MQNDRLAAVLKEIAMLPEFAGITQTDVSMRGRGGNTPLHAAALRGDREAVRVLLEAGADANAAGEHGATPLHLALEEKHAQVARMLVAAGSSLDARNDEGVTAREMTAAVPLWEGEN